MRFIGVRTLENQAALMHHKAREMLVAQRTQLINALRGHLAEMGVVAAQGLKNARELARLIMAEGDETIPACVRMALVPLVRQLHVLDQEIACSHRTIAAMARDDEMARRLIDAGDWTGALRFSRTRQTLKLSALIGRQYDRRGFRKAAHAALTHDSPISDSGY